MAAHLEYWQATALALSPAVLLAAWIDWRHHRVPNRLTASIAAAGVVVQCLYFGWDGVLSAGLGMLVGLGLLIVPWAMYGMGAGDVKLLAAIGAWFGPLMTLVAFCAGALLGGLIAVIMIIAGGKTKEATANLGAIAFKVMHKDLLFTEFASAKGFGQTSQLLPYGVPLTLGALGTLAVQILGIWPLAG